MAAMLIRWYRSRRNLVLIILILLCLIYFASMHNSLYREENLDITRSLTTLASVDVYINLKLDTKDEALDIKNRYIETKLEEALKEDKGTGCEFPQLDPFSKEVTQFDKPVASVRCSGEDWVKCYLSECRVNKTILREFKVIDCTYRDILYINDNKYTVGPPTVVKGGGVYTLVKSDHVKVNCVGLFYGELLPKKWTGHSTGFRKEVERVKPPPGREDSIDVLIFGFDSTARNGFIRRMPKSWEYLNKELEATVLNGMNIVGDGTPATLFPILTGKTELELPDVRKKSITKGSLDDMPFIFYKLKADGYRTAYFEDMPWIGTFQYRFKGFKRQPADHYLRAFYLEEHTKRNKWQSKSQKYCIGDTLQYKLMMNITEQFLELDGKHFAFTFIADITHDDFNMIAIADADTRNFLKALKESGKLERTLLIVMGDHGPRYANVRKTLQGKFEERMPLMAIRLPEVLKKKRPEIAAILKNNSEVLTTPHDIYATILDAMDMQKHWNDYKIKGADLNRGLTLFEPIPRNRSCSEAGVEPHWCACVAWDRVDPADPIADKVAVAFVDYINQLTDSVRSSCRIRTLGSISWVSRRRASRRMLQFHGNRDEDGYVGTFKDGFQHDKEYYQIKVEVGPSSGVYEASATYLKAEDKFIFDMRDISRINAYDNQPACISATHPHLNMYCYCNEYVQV